MYPGSSCPNAYSEDHQPISARVHQVGCERIERLGYDIKDGVYVHCSEQCEQAAILEFAWKAPGKDSKERPPCPPPLDLANHFGEIDIKYDDDSEGLIVGQRRPNGFSV